MMVSGFVLIRARVEIACLAISLAAMSVMGCVDLNRPKSVQECAVNTCSDNPKRPAGPDAHPDTQRPGPDLQAGDRPAPNPDLSPDSFIPDSPTDQLAQNPDTKDAAGTNGKEAGLFVDADSGSLPADSRPDLGPDLNRQDLRPDLRPDLGLDSRPDLPPDLGPDLGRDTSPDTNPLLSGLLVYYRCEGAAGTTLRDSSGKGNDGTLVGGSAGYTFPGGRPGLGNALALARAGSGYVSVPPAVFANATDVTIAFWVNVTTAQNWTRVFDVGVNANIANNTPTGTRYINFVPKNSGTNLAFAISADGYDNEQLLSSTALATGTWKHVTVVLGSGGQGSLYIDGAVVSNSSAISLRPADLGPIDYAYLGKSQFTNDPYLDGRIDEFRVYGRALSAAEVQALYLFAGP